MSHHNHLNHAIPFDPSSTGGGSHSDWWHSEQAILPRLVVAFQASDSPVASQGSTHVPYELPNYPLAQHLPDTRYLSSQTHGGFHNTALPSSGSTDLLFHLPLEVPGGGRLQRLFYNPSHADSQILCDLRSQHSVYSPTSSFSQPYSAASPTYSTGDSSSRGAAPTAAAANIHQQSMDMSIASLDCTIPGSRGTMHLPCAHVSTVPSPVLYDVLPKAPKSRVKKKRKRPDARQLNALNRMYARTKYPPTPEREQLARDINMDPRTVQVWFQNKRQAGKRRERDPSNSPISQVTHPPDILPVVHPHGSPALVSHMDETSYPSFPPLLAMSSRQTPSPPSERPCADMDTRGHWHQAGPSRGY